MAYTSNLIWFDPADDIFDVNDGLAPFKCGDMIKISGGSNSGYWKVNKAGIDHIEVNPKSISHADVGPGITIRRGHTAGNRGELCVWRLPRPQHPHRHSRHKGGAVLHALGGHAWSAYEVVVYARRIGAPGDNLRVGIWSNSSGVARLAAGERHGDGQQPERRAGAGEHHASLRRWR